MPTAEVLGVDHVDLTVTDVARSIPFYETVLGALGFRRIPHEHDYVNWANAHTSIAVRAASPAHAGVAFDRTRVGLHHLALRARSRDDVDRLHALLVREGLTVLDPPAEYPRYGPGYYALFFADPDGMKLELVHFPWGYWRTTLEQGHDERPRHVAATSVLRGDGGPLTGGCHCRAIVVDFEPSTPPEALEVRACTCTFCTAHGARAASDPRGRLRIGIAAPDAVAHYRFALRTADFLVCRRCGVYVAAVLAAADGAWATVNVNALDQAGRFTRTTIPRSYEGETEAQRIARRRERWTPVVGGYEP
jgi:catechol 2,3-dioxygenase-like lactoylglutathione lyase family enzyme